MNYHEKNINLDNLFIYLVNLIKTNEHKLFLKLILNNSSVLNYKNKKGETLAHYCCAYGSINELNDLIQIGFDINQLTHDNNSLLHYSTFFNKDNYLILYLVQNGLSPFSKNKYKRIPIHFTSNLKIANFFYDHSIIHKENIFDYYDYKKQNIIDISKKLKNTEIFKFFSKKIK